MLKKPLLKKILLAGAIASVVSLLGKNSAFAQTAPTLESVAAAAANAQVAADTGYVLVCAAMVLLIVPGLAFFYGGGRSRGLPNTLRISFLTVAIVSVTWMLWGYSLAFAPGNPLIGGLKWLFLNDVGAETIRYMRAAGVGTVTSYAPTIPHQAFMIYQAMLAIVASVLISAAIADRMNFRAYALFVLLWSTFVYSPMAHLVWGNGGLLGRYGGLGFLDFAGGSVVHLLAAVSALVAAVAIDSRKLDAASVPPSNVPDLLLGASLLGLGGLGWHGGSALEAGAVATAAFVSTIAAAGAAIVTWLMLEAVWRGRATAVGTAPAAVVGLVAIAPAAGFVTPIAALLIGSIGAVCCFYAISLKTKLRLVLPNVVLMPDVALIHGVGGTVGTVLTGIFATKTVNAAIARHQGLLFGNPRQLLVQLLGMAIACLLAAVGTFVILKILDAAVGLRVTAAAEFQEARSEPIAPDELEIDLPDSSAEPR